MVHRKAEVCKNVTAFSLWLASLNVIFKDGAINKQLHRGICTDLILFAHRPQFKCVFWFYRSLWATIIRLFRYRLRLFGGDIVSVTELYHLLSQPWSSSSWSYALDVPLEFLRLQRISTGINLGHRNGPQVVRYVTSKEKKQAQKFIYSHWSLSIILNLSTCTLEGRWQSQDLTDREPAAFELQDPMLASPGSTKLWWIDALHPW